MSKPDQELVPAFLLRPDWAHDGRVAVAVILRVPVPEDPGLPCTLAQLLGLGDVADIYAIEPGSTDFRDRAGASGPGKVTIDRDLYEAYKSKQAGLHRENLMLRDENAGLREALAGGEGGQR